MDALRPTQPPGVEPGQLPSDLDEIERTEEVAGSDVAVMSWWFAGLREGGQQVVLYYSLGRPCDFDPIGVRVRETEDAVEIAPLSRYQPSDGACPQIGVSPGVGYVELKEPLGDRSLFHHPVTD
ncbi:hypothetical protein WDH52_19665, partial [Streptomyces sp. TRM70308]|uniref:hypothetical protein n=1 Tax=Streptomyces sp. TRM70308 TaxID=3131932 RepID=UPI003D01F0DB